ncbi:DUF4123 domain-containing protein [Vibrio sp. S9_S30]|uniref:DUF4123 domain-containing protein n=1 Tax=Vibrio sp. S9_S30 TaxID=2720226 RepID=UPI001681BDE8|nr:DUF4123 domain-containing protein [Vibrio sp. S9_S30]MBD1557853.1 DUF4123 domain-containing protein [Vibrio sp. S9_S30]
MIKDWINNHIDSNTLYWIVSSEGFDLAIRSEGIHKIEDAHTFFHESYFRDLKSLSPRMIPIRDNILSLPEDILHLGIIIASSAEYHTLIEHYSSLFHAILDGEEVLFRYHDPMVIAPMLPTMSQSDMNLFLGNAEKVAVYFEEKVTQFQNSSEQLFQPKTSPWWVMKDTHLKPLYKTAIHAKHLERHLWRFVPELIRQHDDPAHQIDQYLQSTPHPQCTESDRETYALANLLATSKDITLKALTEKLHLSAQEVEGIRKWGSLL